MSVSKLYYLFILIIVGNLNAQPDPFYISKYDEVPFVSPSELPDFKDYILDIDKKAINPVKIYSEDLNCLITTRAKLNIIDLRLKEENEYSHILNSKSISFNNFNLDKIWMLDRNTTVILYDLNETDSKYAYSYLKMMGFIDVRILHNGITEWLNCGFSLYDRNNIKTQELLIDEYSQIKLKKGKLVYK